MKVILSNGKIIAFHKKGKVAKKFVEAYENTNPDNLCRISTIPDRIAKSHPRFKELYLEEYGSTYIQSKYLYIHQMETDDLIYELEKCKDTMMKLIECCDKSKDIDTLGKTICIIENNLCKLKLDTPELSTLEEADARYLEYKEKNMED